jgi:DNA repair protein RecO (recombination protein O)
MSEPAAAAPASARARRHDDQPGFVLHSYPYSESSLIVETFTRAHGRVPLLARGAKRPRSTLRGLLLQFQRVGFSWSGKGELKNLVRAEWLGALPPLNQTALFCGFYLNELLLKLLARDDPHERLFDAYEDALIALGRGARGGEVLRVFEKSLLREIGYAVHLGSDGQGLPLEADARYVYEPEHGLRRLAGRERHTLELSGAQAAAIERDDYSDPAVSSIAKQLLRHLIERQMNGRAIATRRIFFALQQP